MAPTTLRAKTSKAKSTIAGAGTTSSHVSHKTTVSTTSPSTATSLASTITSPEAPKLKNLAVYRYATWLEENQLKKTAVWIAVAVAVLIRWVVGLGPYSGQGVPPRFGDYEAQRHWMELTIHRPIREWYSDQSKWWDLDYPPLTAYVSWLCGFVGDKINPEWFAWETSRGYESTDSKLYMRTTVLFFELVIYISAIVVFTQRWFAHKPWTRQHTAVILMLLQPGVILIDSGHFQYNTVMLGLVVWAVNFFLTDQDVLGSVAFCLALGFKQMALYFSPAVFAYLLGKCFRQGFFGCIWKLVKLGLAVIVTLGLLFLPWMQSQEEILQVVHRIFPVFRGLYQDKVANVWCAVNIVIKLRERYDIQSLVRFSTLATMLSFLPSTVHLIAKPTKRGLIYGLVNSSLSFFLLSFQVHEKSILLPALPITLLILDEPAIGSLFNTIAAFSMYPLLRQEGLRTQYHVVLGLWVWMTSSTFKNASSLLKFLATVNLLVIVTMHLGEIFVAPPAKYPDLYAVLNSLWSAAGFVLYWAFFNYRQFTMVNTPKTGFRISTKSSKAYKLA
ncbi:Glucosyltransferase-like protein [Linnemannia zychae]|nr:Glucosyltransferase-like protein [Linnemannia zychae]